jgi:hypothetical protein
MAAAFSTASFSVSRAICSRRIPALDQPFLVLHFGFLEIDHLRGIERLVAIG